MNIAIPAHGGHCSTNCGGPSAVWIVGYLLIAVAFWIGVAVYWIRRNGDDTDNKITAMFAGGITCVMWPISLLAGAIWLIITRLTKNAGPKQ